MKNPNGCARANKLSERKHPRVLHRKMSPSVSNLSKVHNLLGCSNDQYSQLEVSCDAPMNPLSEDSHSTEENSAFEDSQSTEESYVSKDSQSTANTNNYNNNNDTTSQKEWISNMRNKNIDFGNIVRSTFKSPGKNYSGKVFQADKPQTKSQYRTFNCNVKNNSQNLNEDHSDEESISSQKHFDYSALQQPVTTVKGSDFVYGASPSFAVPWVAWKSLGKPMHPKLPYQGVSSLDKNCNPVRKTLPRYYNRGVAAAENIREMRHRSTINTGAFWQNK